MKWPLVMSAWLGIMLWYPFYSVNAEAPPENAEPSIQGPETTVAGELVVLEIVSCPESAHISWLLIGPEEVKCWRAFDQGRFVAFASPLSGTFNFVAAVASTDKLWLLRHTLNNGESPGPLPPPPPPPDFAWDTFARDQAALVKSQRRREEAAALASALLRVVQAVEKGIITDPRTARESVRVESRKALQNNWEAWQPFSQALDAELDKRYPQGTDLKTYTEIWKALARGLQQVS